MPCLFAFVETNVCAGRIIVYCGNDLLSNYPIFKKIYGKENLTLRFIPENCIDDCIDFANYFFGG